MELIEVLRAEFSMQADPKIAEGARAYMKDHFSFFGIMATPRRAIIKSAVQVLRKEPDINWDFVFECFEQEEREFQYTALDYLRKSHKKLTAEHLSQLKSLIISKSWWDSVDALAIEVGVLILMDPSLKNDMREWAVSHNMWIKRVAIIHQLKFRQKTDKALLSFCIEQNLGSKEFFINKAIGWALRTYAEVEPNWVIAFCETHALAPLSRKEALRKINIR